MRVKILHQIWLQGEDKLPDKYKPFVEKWRNIYGKENYKIWSDKMIRKLIKKYLPHLYPLYDSYPYWIQRVDSAKYILLYLYGGLYVDMDMEPLKYCKVLFSYDIILPKLNFKQMVEKPHIKNIFSHIANFFNFIPKLGNGLLYVYKPYHKFFNFILNELRQIFYSLKFSITKYCYVLYIGESTGPIFLSNCVEKYSLYKKQLDVKILDNEFYKDYFRDYCHTTWIKNKNLKFNT